MMLAGMMLAGIQEPELELAGIQEQIERQVLPRLAFRLDYAFCRTWLSIHA
jgi:hypothetical protein